MNTEDKTASADEGSILTSIKDKVITAQINKQVLNNLTLDKNFDGLMDLIQRVDKFIGPLEDVQCRIQEYDNFVMVVFENPWK